MYISHAPVVHMYIVHVQLEGSENRKEKTPNHPTETNNLATTNVYYV